MLLSWAVTRGPSLVPKTKRLAVHTRGPPARLPHLRGPDPGGLLRRRRDDRLGRGRGGSPRGDARADMARGRLTFTLKGARLGGRWHLVRTGAGKERRASAKENWLLIKSDDEAARPEGAGDILAEKTTSIRSGRTIGGFEVGERPARGLGREDRRSEGQAVDEEAAGARDGAFGRDEGAREAHQEGARAGPRRRHRREESPPPPPSSRPASPRCRTRRRRASAGCTRSSSTATASRRASRAARRSSSRARASTGRRSSARWPRRSARSASAAL